MTHLDGGFFWSCAALAALAIGFAVLAPQIGVGAGLRYRGALGLLLFLLIAPVVLPALPTGTIVPSAAPGWCVPYFMSGLLYGFSCNALFTAVRWAATLAEHQLGLPDWFASHHESSLTALVRLYEILAIALFLGLGGHRVIVAGLLQGAQAAAGFDGGWHELLRGLLLQLSGACSMAVQLAAPVILALLGTRVLLALLARVMPQYSDPALAAPVQIALGFILVLLTLNVVASSVRDVVAGGTFLF